MDYSAWGRKELETTEQHTHTGIYTQRCARGLPRGRRSPTWGWRTGGTPGDPPLRKQ